MSLPLILSHVSLCGFFHTTVVNSVRGAPTATLTSQMSFAQMPPEPIINLHTIFLPDFNLSMLDEEEIARQLTLRFASIFSQLRPSEMLDQSWTRPNRLVRSPNVCRLISGMIDHFVDANVYTDCGLRLSVCVCDGG